MIQVDCQVECIPVTAQTITALQASTHTWHIYLEYIDGRLQPGTYQVYTRYILGKLAYTLHMNSVICQVYVIHMPSPILAYALQMN